MDAERIKYVELLKRKHSWPAYPGGEGRGIVVCGGAKFLAYLWMLFESIEYYKCELPIELWHLPGEIDDKFRSVFWRFRNISYRQVDDLGRKGSVDSPPYEIKAYALLRSRFEEVLFLDADNCLHREPSFLFESLEYQEKQALFWRDDSLVSHQLGLGDLLRDLQIPENKIFELETGQMLIHRKRHWEALNLILLMNQNHDYFYRCMLGDKDTFRVAFDLLGDDYAVVPSEPRRVHDKEGAFFAFVQPDMKGAPLFVHQAGGWLKWRRNPFFHRGVYLPQFDLDFKKQKLAELRFALLSAGMLEEALVVYWRWFVFTLHRVKLALIHARHLLKQAIKTGRFLADG